MKKGKRTVIIILGIFFGLVLIIVYISVLSNLFGSKSGFSLGSKVALIEISGGIYGSEEIIDQIEKFKEDSSVKAIVLRIDSPGGVVAPVQEIYKELKRVDKKIVASMGAMAASGGYYISCGADYIFANPGTVTGSIGVIMRFPKLSGLMDKLGVNEAVVKSGKYKDASSLYRDFTLEEKVLFQEVVDDVHDQFLEAVIEGRKNKELTRAELESIADGRLFSGRQALERKLVDELGDLNDAVEYAGKLAGIEGKPRVIQFKPKRKLLERVLRGSLGGKLDRVINDQALLRYEVPL